MNMSSIPGSTTPSQELMEPGVRCARAWSTHDPVAVASCFEETAKNSTNNGPVAIGREAISVTCSAYMETFPDLNVSLDQFLVAVKSAYWFWTLTGTNTGSNGTGNSVRISGVEVWTMAESGLIA